MLTSAPAPGRPLPLVMVTPADWPASDCMICVSGIFSSACELIDVVA
jgi:hypothetical protein